MIWVAVMDFIKKHAEMGGSHGSSAGGVVLGFGGGHGDWSRDKAALVDDTTLVENEEASGAPTSVGTILPTRISEDNETIHVGHSGSDRHLVDGGVHHLVVELEATTGIVLQTHKKMYGHLAMVRAGASGELTELCHCMKNARRSVGEKKDRTNKQIKAESKLFH